MLQYSYFLPVFSKKYEVEIWAKSYKPNPKDWELTGCFVRDFPFVNELPFWLTTLNLHGCKPSCQQV
jgi:hypothetical protein